MSLIYFAITFNLCESYKFDYRNKFNIILQAMHSWSAVDSAIRAKLKN